MNYKYNNITGAVIEAANRTADWTQINQMALINCARVSLFGCPTIISEIIQSDKSAILWTTNTAT